MTESNKYITVKYSEELQRKLSGGFDCNNPSLTAFLKSRDSLDDFFGATYVLIVRDIIVGYYNISTGHISGERNIRLGGTVYLNCFAVDKRFQGQRLGVNYVADSLLHDCLDRIKSFKGEVGFGFVTLSSTEEGYNLYERNGFYELEDDMTISKNPGEDKCVPMYFPLDVE